MKIDRKKINKIIGMDLGTSTDELERYIEKVRVETLGWALAYFCDLMDEGMEPRQVNAPGMLEDALIDLADGGK